MRVVVVVLVGRKTCIYGREIIIHIRKLGYCLLCCVYALVFSPIKITRLVFSCITDTCVNKRHSLCGSVVLISVSYVIDKCKLVVIILGSKSSSCIALTLHPAERDDLGLHIQCFVDIFYRIVYLLLESTQIYTVLCSILSDKPFGIEYRTADCIFYNVERLVGIISCKILCKSDFGSERIISGRHVRLGCSYSNMSRNANTGAEFCSRTVVLVRICLSQKCSHTLVSRNKFCRLCVTKYSGEILAMCCAQCIRLSRNKDYLGYVSVINRELSVSANTHYRITVTVCLRFTLKSTN